MIEWVQISRFGSWLMALESSSRNHLRCPMNPTSLTCAAVHRGLLRWPLQKFNPHCPTRSHCHFCFTNLLGSPRLHSCMDLRVCSKGPENDYIYMQGPFLACPAFVQDTRGTDVFEHEIERYDRNHSSCMNWRVWGECWQDVRMSGWNSFDFSAQSMFVKPLVF